MAWYLRRVLGLAAAAPSLFCGHCHCRFCRQAHGAAFVTWVGFPQAGVRTTADADARRRSMFFESTVAPGETHLVRACIPGKIDRAPEFHTFFDQKVDWVTVDDGLPTLTSNDPALAGYKQLT